jgi:hypothetical protein
MLELRDDTTSRAKTRDLGDAHMMGSNIYNVLDYVNNEARSSPLAQDPGERTVHLNVKHPLSGSAKQAFTSRQSTLQKNFQSFPARFFLAVAVSTYHKTVA